MKIVNIDVKNVKIPVVFENSKSLAVASLRLIFRVAGGCENTHAGLARLAANMLNEGSKSKGAIGFAKELESRAIELYASAGFETFNIEINCLKEHFAFACERLQELLKEPNLTDESLKKCKTIALGEISNNQNDNDYLARVGLNEVLYVGSNLASPSIGSEQSIAKITLDDIKNFLNSHLDLANLYVVFGGDVAQNDLCLVEKVLQTLPTGKARTLKRVTTSDACQMKFIKKQSEQAYIYFGAPYDVAQDERWLGVVATFVLGEGGFGSRLMEEIRVKRGLAYSVYARNVFNLSHTQIYGYLQTKNESKDEAIALVRDEFAKFCQKGVSARELAQAKKFLLGSLPLRLETLFKRLNIAQHDFYLGLEQGAFLKDLERIKALKLGELNEFIACHNEINKLSFCVLFNEI